MSVLHACGRSSLKCGRRQMCGRRSCKRGWCRWSARRCVAEQLAAREEARVQVVRAVKISLRMTVSDDGHCVVASCAATPSELHIHSSVAHMVARNSHNRITMCSNGPIVSVCTTWVPACLPRSAPPPHTPLFASHPTATCLVDIGHTSRHCHHKHEAVPELQVSYATESCTLGLVIAQQSIFG